MIIKINDLDLEQESAKLNLEERENFLWRELEETEQEKVRGGVRVEFRLINTTEPLKFGVGF